MISDSILPSRVVLPPESLVASENLPRDWDYPTFCWRYVLRTLEYLKDQIEIEISDDLKRPAWSAFEIRVDDVLVVIDYSDFPIVSEQFRRYDHWLRFQHLTAFEPYHSLGSFAPPSFLNWNELTELREERSYFATGDKIVCSHSTIEGRIIGLRRRRSKAIELLAERFPERVDSAHTPQKEFLRRGVESLVAVHVPGSQPHSLDRTTQQMFALGVCVVSPDLWTTCCDVRPQPNREYLRISDDFSDLPDVIEWAIENRDRCVEIGGRARSFFDAHSSPHAIWSYVKRRTSRADILADEANRHGVESGNA